MRNKLSTHFYIKESKVNSHGEAPIYLRITVNGERAEVSANRSINPDNWDNKADRVAGRTENARTINATLNTLLGKVEKYFSSLDVLEERMSVHQIIRELKGKSENQITIVQAYEHLIGKMEELVEIDYAPNTIKRYKSSLNGLKEFMKESLHKSDIRLCDLDHNFVESYHSFLRSVMGLKQNSTAKDIKNLYRVINKAVINNWIAQNPFKNFSCNYVNTNREFLTTEEIDSLYEKNFTIKRLAQTRDVFLFQVYTGLSYIDMATLTEENIEIGIDGGKWLKINRQKTGTRSSIPLLPRAQEILDRYKVDPLCIVKGKLLPVCSNQRMNGYLKEVADLCDLTKSLTTHIGRHTFATTVTLTQGVPLETVSKMMGHSSLKTTQIYSKVVDKKIANDMKDLISPVSQVDKKEVMNL